MHDRGSILIDQLMAIALLGIMVAGTLGLFGVAALATRMAREHTLAGELAAEKLEEITGCCEEPAQVSQGSFGAARFPGYEWRVDVNEVAPALQQVTVIVSWSRLGKTRSVSLTTLVRRMVER